MPITPRIIPRRPERTIRLECGTIIDWGLTLALAGAAVLIFQAEVAKPYRIPSPSMEPTLHCAKPVAGSQGRFSDRVIANRLAYHLREPERGDIIVFKTTSNAEAVCRAGGTFVKRVIGLPGERVAMRKGHVLVDGARLTERYLHADYRGHETGSWGRVPADSYFLMGDNRRMSCDSRRWGAVRREDIIGRADVTYWPPRRIGQP
jgi:signal peptidase I